MNEGIFIVNEYSGSSGGGYGPISGESSDDYAVGNGCRTVLGYRNILSVASLSGSADAYVDPIYPLQNMFDYSYHSEFSPNLTTAATSVVLNFSYSGVQQVSYFSMISKNAQESALQVMVEVLNAESGLYEAVGGFGSMTNGKPVMIYFGKDYQPGYVNALAVRVTLSYTAKPYIMTMNCGKAIVFPRTFSLGFQPGDTAFLDEVEQFYADDGLNLTIGRRMARGKQLKGTIGFVKMTTLREFWIEYTNHVLDSKPFTIMWNTNLPSQVMYGVQVPDRHTKPAYKNQMFASVDFEVIGWA